MTRIIIADDHAVVCTGMGLILEAAGGFVLAGEARNGNELLAKLASERDSYDLVILDISMPGREALSVLREIRQLYPGLPVVIFTMNPEEPYAMRFFRQGASAYIKKDSHPEEIINALRTVASGKKHLTSKQLEWMTGYLGESPAGRNSFDHLTDREIQVLHLLATGAMKADIARKLEVSKNTISNHRNNILKKLNLRNNAELARYALQNGLIS